MVTDLTKEYFLHHFTVAVTLGEWALLYPAVVDRREPVNLYIKGKPRQAMITQMLRRPIWTEDENVYLSGYYDTRTVEH